jgi:drug/metabolite transporter (DMT)-like permease
VDTWILLTLLAAFLQTLRSGLQKRATRSLSVNGASYLRFLYGLPFACLYAVWLTRSGDAPLLSAEFFGYALTGGVAQIVGTAALIASFSHGNFAVGTTFSKTEVVLTALIGLVLLGDTLDLRQWSGIAVSFLGVGLLTAQDGIRQIGRNRRALALGLASGTGFAIAAVSYRAAALSLTEGDYLQRAGLTLVATLSMQTLIMGAYLLLREPGELRRVLGSWRSGIWIGLLGAAASAGWFSAMTLVSAALVRALGQVELLFSFVASIWFFRERVRAAEVVGALLVVLGIWLIV